MTAEQASWKVDQEHEKDPHTISVLRDRHASWNVQAREK